MQTNQLIWIGQYIRAARPDEVVRENIDSIRSMRVCMQLVVGPVNGSINNSISFKNYILYLLYFYHFRDETPYGVNRCLDIYLDIGISLVKL